MKLSHLVMVLVLTVASNMAYALERTVALPYDYSNSINKVYVPKCLPTQYVSVSDTVFICKNFPKCQSNEYLTRIEDDLECKALPVAETPSCAAQQVQWSQAGVTCTANLTSALKDGESAKLTATSESFKVDTRLITPDGAYLGTGDDFRGGGYNGVSTPQGASNICNAYGSKKAKTTYRAALPLAYACVPSGSVANSSHNGSWGYYVTGQGWCQSYGVQWVQCIDTAVGEGFANVQCNKGALSLSSGACSSPAFAK